MSGAPSPGGTYDAIGEDPADIEPFREGRDSVVPVVPVFQGLAAPDRMSS